jgi:catechol 2,3-dioxygenase-like lactoylglutathione lyase family enzyme
MKITGADHANWRVRDLERSLGFYRDVLGLEPLGLEEFHRCSRSPGNPHVEELQTIAHEGGIFLIAVRLGAYSEVGYLVPSFRVRSLGLWQTTPIRLRGHG